MALTDTYPSMVDSPGRHAAAVSLSDTVDLTCTARALYVGTTGDVTLITAGGDTVTFPTVPAGAILPVLTTRVKSTLTTASNIVALW